MSNIENYTHSIAFYSLSPFCIFSINTPNIYISEFKHYYFPNPLLHGATVPLAPTPFSFALA